MSDPPPEKPAILYAVPPREGHMRPALQISSHLARHGFDVTILGSPRWQGPIEAAGGHFSPIVGLWNSLDDPLRWPTIAFAPSARARLAASLAEGFATLLPSGWHSVWLALATLRRRVGAARRIVVLADTCFSGAVPLRLGADLPPPESCPGGGAATGSIGLLGISVVPAHWVSAERPPWGSGLPFDGGEAGVARNMAAHAAAWDQEAEDRARMVLNMMNCSTPLDALLAPYQPQDGDTRRPRHPFWDAVSLVNDTTLQMGLSSLEFPARDWPAHFRFAGALPLKPLPADLAYPAWWDADVTGNSASSSSSPLVTPARRRIVMVTQGTEVLDWNQLLVPTIQGLADRADVLVVALLAVRGASLDAYLPAPLPANARVLDYFPYDAVLAHADVFVSNSGYGGLTHAVANGVPMVQTGRDFDKPDIGRRVEYAGLGVYLSEPPPSPEEVRSAVDEVLGDARYKRRAEALKAEAVAARPLEAVEREIMKLAV